MSLKDLVQQELDRSGQEANSPAAFTSVELGSATYTKMLGKRY